jgi:hypothetical protein
MPFVLFVGSGEIASDERSPLRGGGTPGQDFQTRGENIFLKHISDLFPVLPTGRLFGRIIQKGPNKKQSGRTKLQPNICRFCTERAVKGPYLLKTSYSPLILFNSVRIKEILYFSQARKYM